MRERIGLFLALSVAFGASHAPASTAADAPATSVTTTTPANVVGDDVREAVFRHMFGKNASGQGTGAGVYCLAVEGAHDPSVALLARFKNVKKPVRPVSGCTASANQGVVDNTTHARGLLFRIDSIAFKDASHATVHGGYYEAGLSASGNVYTVEKKTGIGWVVVKDQMMWIS